MELATIWQQSHDNTVRASETARKAAYAGIAIIWVFRETSQSGDTIPKLLVLSGGFLIIALAIDLFQYTYMSLRYRSTAINFKKELVENNVPDTEHGLQNLPLPMDFHSLSYLLFWAKLIAVFAAYGVIIVYLFKRYVVC